MDQNRIESLKRAVNSAESALKQAKQILTELDSSPKNQSSHQSQPNPNEKPGEIGIYDGEKMTTSKGEAYVVPGNYASKSLLVVGDTLKMYEENGEKRFKQIEHVKRHKTTGLLVKKDGKFRAITPEGSYKVLTESINHFGGEVGDEVLLHLPAGNLTSPYGAIETIRKKTPAAPVNQEETPVEPAKAADPVPVEKPKSDMKKVNPPKLVKVTPKAAPHHRENAPTSTAKPVEMKETVKPVATAAIETPAKIETPEVEVPATPGEEELS